MKKELNQNTLVLKYIKEHGSITNVQAVMHLNCYRLSARISDLRNMGYNIKTTYERNASGDGNHARYTLEENNGKSD